MSERSFRLAATGGFLVAAAAASILAVGAGSAWWLGLPVALAHAVGLAAFLLHAWALRKGRVGAEAGAFALLLVAYAPVADAAPDAATWLLAALAAAGAIVALEAAFAARRLEKLAEAEGAQLERVAGPLRGGLATPLVGVLLLVVLARPFGRALLGLAGDDVHASLEAAGLLGAAFGLAVLAALLGAVAWARHVKQASDAAGEP